MLYKIAIQRSKSILETNNAASRNQISRVFSEKFVLLAYIIYALDVLAGSANKGMSGQWPSAAEGRQQQRSSRNRSSSSSSNCSSNRSNSSNSSNQDMFAMHAAMRQLLAFN